MVKLKGVVYKVRSQGNMLQITLPAALAHALDIKAGDLVEYKLNQFGELVIRKVQK